MLAADKRLTVKGVTITGGNAGNQPGGGILDPWWDVGAVEVAGPGEIFVENFDCGFTTGWSDVAR